MIDWVEVDQLLHEGYHPYSFRSGKGEYMCLKKGGATRGLGRFNQKDWDTLQARYAVMMEERSQEKPPKASKNQKVIEKKGEAKRTEAPAELGQSVRLDDVLLSAGRDWQTSMQMREIFEMLEKKWTPTQIVAQGRNPLLVEACAKKHAELTALESKPEETVPTLLQDQLEQQITSLQRQVEETPTKLKEILKPLFFQGKLRMNQCRHFKDDLCTLEYDANLMKDAPIDVVEEKDTWGTAHIHIKPTPLWCACCPHHSM
ncbi:hypothetical protein KEJ15_01145 [Candidatus Bathyarchaeota archaeon]|nr:hypothetical protein [Candidatus Bathyarchaeota archaeon]